MRTTMPVGDTKLWHATRKKIAKLKKAPFSATHDKDASLEYLLGQSGYLYEVLVPKTVNMANDRDAYSIAYDFFEIEEEFEHTWQLIEEVPDVVVQLASHGYDGIVLKEDIAPGSMNEHETWTFFDPVRSGLQVRLVARVKK